MQELYLVCDRNSSAQDGVVLDVVDQEAGVVKHLDDVADLTHLEERGSLLANRNCCLSAKRKSWNITFP